MSGITVISATCQEFAGVRYYLCGKYFQRKGRRLHRTIWESLNGPVPDGSHVHHIDNNRSNNDPANLICISQFDHLSGHGKEHTPEHLAKFNAMGREAAKSWHSSPEGIEWHRQHLANTGAFKPFGSVTCARCSVVFDVRRIGQSFCSNACKAAARRASGVDDEARICASCRCAFRVNRYSHVLNCSRTCGGSSGAEKRLGREAA